MKKLFFVFVQLGMLTLYSQAKPSVNQEVVLTAKEKAEVETLLINYFTVIQKEEFEKLDGFYFTQKEAIDLFAHYHQSAEYAVERHEHFLKNKPSLKHLQNIRKNRDLLFRNWNPSIEFQNIMVINCSNSFKASKGKLKKDYPAIVELSFILKNNGDQREFINFAELIRLDTGWKIWNGPTYR